MISSNTNLFNALEELRDQLGVRHNPDRRAFDSLKPNHYGCTQIIYSDEAFQIWNELLERHPDNHRTLHHLAIMHHARAFDLERSARPADADADWQMALNLWHRLWLLPSFWESLSGRLQDTTQDPIPQLHERWPVELLQIHFDLAFSDHCKHYRALQHVQFALASPFSEEAKDEVRKRTYDRLTSHLPSEVWEPDIFAPEIMLPGLTAIRAYLEFDEHFVTALSDLLDLVTRLQTGYVQQTNATETTEQFQARLQDLRLLGTEYEPYAKCLENSPGTLEPRVLSNLLQWHSRMGQVAYLSGNYGPAAEYYRRALGITLRDTSFASEVTELRNEWLKCRLAEACELATRMSIDVSVEESVRTLLYELDAEPLETGICFFLRANTYKLLGDFKHAEQDCVAALSKLAEEQLAINPQYAQEAVQLAEVVRAFTESVRYLRRQAEAGPVVDQALAEMSNLRWDRAITILTDAMNTGLECSDIYYLRARCFRESGYISIAKNDVQQAIALAEAADDASALPAIKRLMTELDTLDESSREGQTSYNNKSLDTLWDETLQEKNAGHLPEARHLVNQVLTARPDFLPAQLLHIELLMTADDLETALQKINELSRRASLSEEDNKNILQLKSTILYQRAHQLLELGQPEEALVDLEWIISNDDRWKIELFDLPRLKAEVLFARLRQRSDWMTVQQALADVVWLTDCGELTAEELCELQVLRVLLLKERAEQRMTEADFSGATRDVLLALGCRLIDENLRTALLELQEKIKQHQ